MHISTYTCRIHIDAIIKTSEDFFQKYTPHFIWKVACERELETEQNCNILTPTVMAINIVSFSSSRVAQPDARGSSSLLDPGFLYRILSPTGLIFKLVSKTNWLPVFTELYNSSIAHSISLEWHVWSSRRSIWNTNWLFQISQNPPVHDVIRIHWSTFHWDFYFDIYERHILPARALKPALKFATNPCTKPKGSQTN